MPAAPDHLARAALRLRGFTSRFVDTSVGRVHLMVGDGRGSETPVLLLHGLGSAGVHFRPLVKHLLAWSSRVILPDIPAHGFSDPPSALDVGSMRAAIREAVEAEVKEPVVVYGNSMGGLAAIGYALDRPERVRALVLCSPGGAAMSAEDLEDLLSVFKPKTHADALAFIDRLLAKRSLLRHLFALGVRRRFAQGELQALLATVSPEALLKPEDVAAIGAPTLLIWGKEERILPPANLAFFKAHAPAHVRIIEPEGFGHSPHLEQPARLSKLVAEFVGSLGGR